MRILYVVHQFFPEFVGGTEQDTLDVAQEMQRRGHRVTIFHRAPGSGGLLRTNREEISLYRGEFGPMTPWTLFTSTFRHQGLERAFRTAFQETQPDLVHFQHLRGLPTSLISQTRQWDRPLIISLRDFWFVCPNAQLLTNDTEELCQTPGSSRACARCALARAGIGSPGPLTPMVAPIMKARNRLLRQAMTKADPLLTFSQFVWNWYARNGAPEKQLQFVKRGIPRPEHWPSRSRNDKQIRFTYIGGLSWQKGLHIAIDAFNEVGGAAELIIAGDETKFPDYVGDLQRRAVHPDIHLVGRLDRSEVWQTLVNSDVVVVPSLWFETFSMLTHEAFAAGKPVMASAHGALEEAVRHNVDGLLVPPGDVNAWQEAMQRLVDDPDLLARLQANVCPPMTLEEHVDRIEDLYAKLVDSNTQAC